jgi:hypothetical protein
VKAIKLLPGSQLAAATVGVLRCTTRADEYNCCRGCYCMGTRHGADIAVKAIKLPPGSKLAAATVVVQCYATLFKSTFYVVLQGHLARR